MTPVLQNRPSNSGMPSNRNRRTTDGLPICNKCDRIGHIARNCSTGASPRHQRQRVPHYDSSFRSDRQPLAHQYNSPIRPDAPSFNYQPQNPNHTPFQRQSGNL